MDDIKRVQLSEIAELITKGTTPTTLGYEFQDSGVNFLKIECFDENGVFIKNKVAHISKECHEKLKRSQLKNGDILFSIAGAIGRVAIVTEEMLPANTNQALAIIRITNEEVYLPYIKLILTSPIVKDQFEKKKQGVAQLNLSLKDINEISIPLPNIEKQIELAELFGKVANVIAKRNEEIKSLDELIKARFVELFGDPNVEFKFPESKFKEYAKDMTKGPFGSDMKKDLFVPKGGDTYKVYIQANAIQGDQNIGDYYISKEYFDSKIFKFEVKPGDYIITCDGTLGKHLKLNEKMERGVISPSLLRITLDENKMTKEYFEGIWDMYMLLLMKKEARNACLIHLPSAKVIGEIDIPIPPFELQKEFSLFVKQVDKSKFAVQKSLEETQLLFDSLMRKYFG